jgi:FkbM family methyltransferase
VSIGAYAWRLRRRIVGAERVVTGDAVATILAGGSLSVRGRARVRTLHLRELALGPAERARIPVGRARVELGGAGSFPVDWRAFVEVLAEQPYRADYTGAAVVDVGAHKGYFGAFALERGARQVLSVEPESTNFAALARAAEPLAPSWLVRNAAVAEASGTGTLRLAPTSWAHSLAPIPDAVGEQPVQLVTLAELLDELAVDGARTIVKVDAEGGECEIVRDADTLGRIDVLLVEWHSETASCTAEELVRRVTQAGFVHEPRAGALHFARPS